MPELIEKIRQYRECKLMIEELEQEANAVADEIKAAMIEAGQDRMVVGDYKLAYYDVTRTTIDTQRLEADLGDLSEYKKTTTYKQFRVA